MLKNIDTLMVLSMLFCSSTSIFCMKRSHQQAQIAESSSVSPADSSLHADKKKLDPNKIEITISREEYDCMQANYRSLERAYGQLKHHCSVIIAGLDAENNQLRQLLSQQQTDLKQAQRAQQVQAISESAYDVSASQALVSSSSKKPNQSRGPTTKRR